MCSYTNGCLTFFKYRFYRVTVVFHFEKEEPTSVDVARHPPRMHAYERLDGNEIRPRYVSISYISISPPLIVDLHFLPLILYYTITNGNFWYGFSGASWKSRRFPKFSGILEILFTGRNFFRLHFFWWTCVFTCYFQKCLKIFAVELSFNVIVILSFLWLKYVNVIFYDAFLYEMCHLAHSDSLIRKCPLISCERPHQVTG